MTDLKEILFVCSLLFFFFALVTVWALIASVFELIFKRKKIDWSMFNLADFFKSAFSEKHSMTGKIVYGIVSIQQAIPLSKMKRLTEAMMRSFTVLSAIPR